jgi:DNA repair exonuclease SbcCD ATPase subunit
VSAVAQPITSESCNAKRDAIERDIDAAKAKGQAQRVRGLERAMRANQRNCSEAQLQAEHRKRIQAQERKVAERQRDLNEAKEKGRADKIAQRESKLREEEAELERLKTAH